MEKDFSSWIKIKTMLHQNNYKPPYFKEREIWWCSVGENIGSEMNGKNIFFRRPILIVKKLDHYSFLGIPLTGKIKEGTWYVKITHGENINTAVVSQVRNFDYRRLDKKMATLDEGDFDRVVAALVSFLREK